MDQVDIAWVAGILEGEGSFDFRGRIKGYPAIRVAMADEDVVGILGVGNAGNAGADM